MAAIPDEIELAKAQKLIESGKSLRNVAIELDRPHMTIQGWVHEYGWVKGALRTQIIHKEEESILKIAESIGATKRHVIQKAYDLSNAKEFMLPTGNSFIRVALSDNQKTDSDGNYTLNGETGTEASPDRKTQIEGNKMLADILKMRDKDNMIIMPSPVLIRSMSGHVIEELGVKNE